MQVIYRVKLTPAADYDPADHGYVVTFPEWEYGVTQGDGEAAALAMAEDALAIMASDALTRREPLPAPSASRLAGDERRVVLSVESELPER